jgi:hypothetical protein
LNFIHGFENYFKGVMKRSVALSLRGAMMGFPASWAVMPLLTCYAYEASSTERWTCPDGLHPHPLDWRRLSTCGDDMVGRQNPVEARRHTLHLESLDGVLSPTKDAYVERHDGPAVYLEALVMGGKSTDFTVFSPSVGAPGVSVCNWTNSCASQAAQFEKFSNSEGVRRRVLRLTSFRSEYKYAQQCWSLPVSLDPELGGLGVKYPHYPLNSRKKSAVCWYYESLNSFEYFARDARLTLVESSLSDGLRWAREQVFSGFINSIEPDDGFGIPAADLWLVLATPYFSAEIFSGKTYERPLEDPLFSKCSRKFWSNVRSAHFDAPNYVGDFKVLEQRLAEKHTPWQIRADAIPPYFANGFGLVLPGIRKTRLDPFATCPNIWSRMGFETTASRDAPNWD